MHIGLKSFCIVLFTIVLLSSFISPVLALEKSVTTDILADVTGNYNATFELQLGDNFTLLVNGLFLYRNVNSLTLTGFAAGSGLAYYFHEALDGFYVSGGMAVMRVSGDGIPMVDFGLITSVGYKKVLDNGLTLSGNVGLNAINEFALGLEIGYAF